MTAQKALIVYGGWTGHHPEQVADLMRRVLTEDGFEVELAETLGAFDDVEKLKSLSLIIPHWTMGRIAPEQAKNVCEAVADGVGLAGCHGGLCDAFRDSTDWHFLTGAQWVAHPGDQLRYAVHIETTAHPIARGIADFEVATEQYYLHIDPAVEVLATTHFPVADGPHAANGGVDMPVVFTKRYGRGRVFYNSLGHDGAVLEAEPVLTILRRGFLWAARGSSLGG